MRRTTRLRWLGAAVLTMSMALTACGSDDSGSSDEADEFRVLALLPVSGPIATITKMNTDAMKATANIINDEYGGIDGRKIVIQVEDTALDAAKAVSALQAYLSSNDAPDLLIPGLVSNEILAVLPLATQNKIFTTNVGTVGNDPSEFPYNFATMANYENNMNNMVEKLVQDGHKTVAFMGTESATGRGVGEALEAAAGPAGLTFTGAEYMDPAAVDVSANLLRLQAEDPDALVITASGPPVGVMLSSRTKIDWDVPVYCDGSCAGNALDKISDPVDWNGVILQAYPQSVKDSDAQKSPAFQRMFAEYLKVAGGQPTEPLSSAVSSYNWLWLARAAYESTDSDDAADLAKVLENSSSEVDEDIRNDYLGPTDWQFSNKSHAMVYSIDDQLFVPAGPTVDGVVVPAS